MNRVCRFFVLVFALFVWLGAEPAFAQTSPQDDNASQVSRGTETITIEFPIPPEDVSYRFLYTLFGDAIDFMMREVVRTDQDSTQPYFASSASSVGSTLSGMFKIFSWACAVGASLIIFFMTLIALANTAVEGEPMGRGINTFWTPIRIATAISFVAPIPQLGGLSFLQGIILLLSLVSISFANTMYKYVIDSIAGGQPLSYAAGAQIKPQVLVNAAIVRACVEGGNAESVIGNPLAFEIEQKDGKLIVAGTSFFGSATCGKIEISCEEAPDQSKVVITNLFGESFGAKVDHKARFYEKACAASLAGYRAAIEKFDESVQDILSSTNPSLDNIASDFSQAIKAYYDTYQGAFKKAKEEYQQELARMRQAGSGTTDEIAKRGWLLAGGWYMFIASETHELSKAIEPIVSYSNFDSDAVRTTNEKFVEIMTLVQSNLLERVRANFTPESTAGMQIDEVFTLQSSAEDIAKSYYGRSLNATGLLWRQVAGDYPNDPLRSLASFGHNLISTVAAMYFAGKAIPTISDIPLIGPMVSSAIEKGMSKGGLIGKAASSLMSSASDALSIIPKILLLLLVVGFMLAYYLPFVPTLYWLGGAIGWLLMVLESIIAAPLWAVAHAIPSQEDGFAGRWALQGYQLLTNVIVRPLILILALIMTIFLFQFGAFIFMGILMIASPFITNSVSYTSLTFTIMSLIILVIGLVMVAHRTHEFIYQGADRIISWLGFGVSSLGTTQSWSEMEGRVKYGLQGAQSVAVPKRMAAPK